MVTALSVLPLFVIIIIFSAYLFFREVKINQERDLWHKERQQLLDRIMSRDFSEFKVLTETPPKVEEEPPEIDDELGVNY